MCNRSCNHIAHKVGEKSLNLDSLLPTTRSVKTTGKWPNSFLMRCTPIKWGFPSVTSAWEQCGNTIQLSAWSLEDPTLKTGIPPETHAERKTCTQWKNNGKRDGKSATDSCGFFFSCYKYTLGNNSCLIFSCHKGKYIINFNWRGHAKLPLDDSINQTLFKPIVINIHSIRICINLN